MSSSQCWAHNSQGQRCELDGGHAGDHILSVTWGDEETLIPGAVVKAPQRLSQPRSRDKSEPGDSVTETANCELCGHEKSFHSDNMACVACDCRGFLG